MSGQRHSPLSFRQVGMAMFLRLAHNMSCREIAREIGVCRKTIVRLHLPSRASAEPKANKGGKGRRQNRKPSQSSRRWARGLW